MQYKAKHKWRTTAWILLLSALGLSPGLNSAWGFDLAKENRMKEQIIDFIMDGEAVMLNAGQHAFLSIFMETEAEQAKGAVIIMHGRGYHPNWPELVYPLRTGLTEYGWHTLSIQMPVLDNASSFYDYLKIVPEAFPRFEAALDFLRQQSIENIVLVSHSCSVHMSLPWLLKNPQQKIAAYIGIGMGSTDVGQPMLKAFELEKISIPVLDIRGEFDTPSVISFSADRWTRIQQAGHKKSAQRVIAKADHYFTAQGEALTKEVADWLNNL